MGLFKKKPDPISERARELNAKIAALQTQIKQLSERRAEPTPQAQAGPAQPAQPVTQGQPSPTHAPFPSQLTTAPASPHAPRLRSTALPHGPTIHPTQPAAPPPQEPIFEELDPKRLKEEPAKKPNPPDLAPDLGMRKNGLWAFLEKLKTHLRGPATSNPKLVNYLAAGSIQGLRPLRYEKRIARNRFILLTGGLIFALWIIIALVLKHR